jgi:hypothetical protein
MWSLKMKIDKWKLGSKTMVVDNNNKKWLIRNMINKGLPKVSFNVWKQPTF